MLKLIKSCVFISIIAIVCVSIGLTLLLPNQSSAHPGRTDSDGGHYCRTNCEYWGYTYGTWHSHNGYSVPTYSPSLTEQGRTDGKKYVEEERKLQIDGTASISGQTKGYEDGYAQKENSSWDSTALELICDQEITFTTIPQYEYKTAFQSSYEENCKLIYDEKYKTAYEDAYSKGDAKFDEEEVIRIAEEKEKTEKRNNDILLSVLVIGGISMLSYYIYTTYWKSKR
jgi:hypothetical protein